MRIPYAPVKGGNRYFQPTPAMRALGFFPMALGPDNEASRRRALQLYERWQAARLEKPSVEATLATREQVCAARHYPPGSIGEAWQVWIRSDEWARMASSTRHKIWWEAWLKRIDPAFGQWRPDQVTMADLSEWRGKIAAANGPDAAHKALKVWRALWRVMRGLRYTQLSDPSEKVKNTAPPPRHQRFDHGEAMRLAKGAWRLGYRGLACIILAAWDGGFAPKDCRTARKRHLGADPRTGLHILDRSGDGREKTGVAVIGTFSRFGDLLVRRYLADMGAAMTAESFLFRMRSGVPYGESRLGGDFAAVREAVMPGDKRQLRDLRRSGVVEAFAGGAGAADVSQKYGNTIGRSNALFKTYNPVDLDQVRNADAHRRAGRRARNKAEP